METMGYYVPETKEEANGEVMGRCNSLHDWAMMQAQSRKGSQYFTDVLSSDLQMVCVLMGFADVLAVKKEEPIATPFTAEEKPAKRSRKKKAKPEEKAEEGGTEA